jgi:HEAT repeat protein
MRRKRRWLWVGVLLALLIVGPVLPWGYYAVVGLWRDEHFYHGLPSSYWASKVGQFDQRLGAGRRPLGIPDKLLIFLGVTDEMGLPAVIAGSDAAVRALSDLLQDENEEVRRSACAALGNGHTEEAFPVLVQALHNRSFAVRMDAARGLSNYDRDEEVRPHILELLRDEEFLQWLHKGTLFAIDLTVLAKLAGPAPESVHLLVPALHNEDETVRDVAAELVGRLGPVAADSLPALLKAMHDQDPLVRQEAMKAVGKVSPDSDQAVRALVQILQQEGSVSDCKTATSVLAEMGPRARSAVPALVAGLRDNRPDARASAAKALKVIDPEAARKSGHK